MRKLYSDRQEIWRRTALAGAVAACFAGNTALANPTGPAVTQGQASFATQGSTLTVTNAPGTVINWQGFSIAGSEITRFIQQSQMSAVLNRVVGVNPSAILGTLQSNGRVYLVNPNGITVGPGANIDVAGFLASTLNLSDGDFLSGRMRFAETPGAGSVVNEGAITTATGGMVYLVGRDVKNSGIIHSPQGEILLAAGRSIELVDARTPELRVELTAPDNQVLNVGQLIAEGGRIGMYGTLVAHSGVASANTAVMGENGKIVFKAVQDVTLDAGSVTTASGPQGGSVTVQAENGTLLVSGTVEAKGDAGKGGTIQLTGDRVGLTGNAAIDASGLIGGGTVLVGGDFQGSNAEVQNAWRTYVGAEASIKADAIESGDGGKVIVWADDITRAYGTISARGGPQGGDGGFVEVSGKNQLDFAARVDASAPMGVAGTLLLDPTNITVANTGVATTTQVDAFADAGGTLSISPTALKNAGTTVVLQATQDITVNAPVNLETLNAGFTAQAGRDVNINAALTTNAGKIILEADSPHQPGFVPDGVGLVRINAPVNSCGGAVPATCTGANITLIGGGASSPTGGFVLNADVNAGNGGINVALSTITALDFFIGAGGNTQLSSNDTGSLKTTGTLVLGRATSGGPNGLGTPVTGDPSTGAVVLTVDSLSQLNATPIELSANSGSTFQLVAGDGGITLDRNLTTFQTTIIETSGTFTLNSALNTTDNNLVISAVGGVNISGGSITTGTGLLSCAGTGCPVGSFALNEWNVDASGDWFTGSNWLLGHAPLSTEVVRIDRPSGTYTISLGTASIPASSSVALLLNSEILNVTGNNTTKSSLGISSSVVYNGSTASSNFGTINLTDAILSGSGALINEGSFNLTNSTISNAGLTNQLAGAIAAFGTNSMTGAFTMSTGTLTINNGASLTIDDLILTGGSVTGAGNLTVATDFIHSGGTLASTLNGLTLRRSGDFVVGAAGYAATNFVKLSASGAMILDGTVSADGTGDAVVVSGTSFVNNAGASALSAPNGRWLVYSTNPAGNTFGGLVSGNKAIWGRSYPTAVSETGNRYVFADVGAVTVTTTDASKTYGDVADVSSNYLLSGDPLNAAGYGNVFIDATLSDVFASGPTISSAGSVATASVAGAPYSITGTGTANSGFALTFVNDGLLTVTPAALSVTANSTAKTYGQTVSFNGTEFISSGLQNSEAIDTVTLTSAGAAPTAGVAGSPYAIVPSAATGATFNAGNYTITYNNGTLTVSPAALSVTANSTAKTYGQTVSFNGTEFISSGLQNSETIGTVTLTSAGAAATAGVAGSPYAIAPSAATGGSFDAGNYTITYNNGTLTVSPAVIGLAGTREYDGTLNFAAGTFGAINGVNGETLTLSGSGTVASPKVLAGTQALTLGTLALGNGTGLAANYTLTGGVHTGTITASVTFPFVWDLGSATDLDWGNPANWNQGAVPLNGATASIPSGLAGPVVYSGASGATGLATLSSGSGFTITGGTLTLGNSTADVSTFSGRPLTLSGGTLDGVGTISLAGTTLDVLAGGVLGGSRTIIGNVHNLAGTVSPGASPGTLTIDGNYLQGPSGTLLAEIGGLAAGTQYDQLLVSGTVTLDGNLNVALGNGFIPATGDTFTIIDSGGGVSGTFATTSLPSAPSMQVNLLASSVNVTTGTVAPVDTAQLISFQINQIDASLPTETDMSKFIVVTDPITNETFVTVGAVEIAVSGGAKERTQKPGVCR